MTHDFKSSAVLFSLFAAIASSVYAAQPPDVVTGDGNYNTAMGLFALQMMSAGAVGNTAAGYEALWNNTTGDFNTAFGSFALNSNVTGTDNTASGYGALSGNTHGSGNSAFGQLALLQNSTGTSNTATGYAALASNTTANNNTASGSEALYSNTTGYGNTGSGFESLYSNKVGIRNTAAGSGALQNSSGSYNTALGYQAGLDLTTGSYNIDIGNLGVAGESGTIRIGTAGTQTTTYIAGIDNSKITGSAVYVTSSGQLGVLASSERYKTDIVSMGARTGKMEQLRPVTFRLKSEPHGQVQYGLIAEEVSKVYPELVIHGVNGRIEGVRYDELAPMLLNEVQKQQRTLTAQAERMTAQEQVITAAAQQLRDMQAQLAEVKELKRQIADLQQHGRSVHASMDIRQPKVGPIDSL